MKPNGSAGNADRGRLGALLGQAVHLASGITGVWSHRQMWRGCCGIVLLALIVRIVVFVDVLQHPQDHISGYLVMGVPFSDAQGWDALGESVMRGDGLTGAWSARRPFMALAISVLYTITGPSPTFVVLAQIVLGALTAGMVCRVGQRVFHPAAGLAAGVVFTFDPLSIEYTFYTATETLGTFLFVLCVLQLLVALQERRRSASFWAGVSFALSNLTRTLTILGAPLFALILLLARGRQGEGRRAGVVLALLFTVGASVPLGAWVCRQKVVHDLSTISDNTASGLFAAASPRYGSWTGAVDREAEEAGVPPTIKDRYDWFMKRFHEELAADPSFFVGNALASVAVATETAADSGRIARGCLVFLLLVGLLSRSLAGPARGADGRARWRKVARRWALAAVVVAIVLKWPAVGTGGLAVFGAVAALRARWATSFVVVTGFVSVVAAMGLFALGHEVRLLLMIGWIVTMTAAFGALALNGRELPHWAAGDFAPKLPRRLARVSLAVFALSLSFVAWRNFVRPLPPEPALPRMTPERARAHWQEAAELLAGVAPQADREQALEGFRIPETVKEMQSVHGRWVITYARLSRHRYRVPPGLVVNHYSRMFEVRPYEREYVDLVFSQSDWSGPSTAVFSSPTPPAGASDLLIVGRVNVDPDFYYEEMFLEVLAWREIEGSPTPAWQLCRQPHHLTFVQDLVR